MERTKWGGKNGAWDAQSSGHISTYIYGQDLASNSVN